MRRGEEHPGRDSRRPNALPVAQRAKDVAAKEELFLERREDREDHDQDDDGQRSVRTQAIGQCLGLLAVESER